MKQIENSIRLPSLPVTGLSHVRDLIYFDGPLLSQYEHPRGDSYLYFWCDSDDIQHRWMLIRVAEFDILQLRYKITPLDFVIPDGNLDDYVYFVDSDSTGIKQVSLCLTANIPSDYCPGKGAYLDEDAFSEDESTYAILVDGEIDDHDLFRIPQLMKHLYSFQYAKDVLGIQGVTKLPWRGGFSSTHFDNWIANTIPFEARLSVDRFSVASPGFVRFCANHKVMKKIAECAQFLHKHRAELSKAQQLVLDHISKNGNWEKYDPSESEWQSADTELKSRLDYFLQVFVVLDAETVYGMTSSVFEAAQVSRWWYRRLSSLEKLVRNGLVKLPPEIS